MECGGEWKHPGLLGCVPMSDGMGGCGLHGEVWEAETLSAAITPALWEVQLRRILFLWVNLCLFVCHRLVRCLFTPTTTTTTTSSSSRPSHLLLVVFLTFLAHSSSPFVFRSLSSCVSPPVSAHHSPLILLSIGAVVNNKLQIQIFIESVVAFRGAVTQPNTLGLDLHLNSRPLSFQRHNSVKLVNPHTY